MFVAVQHRVHDVMNAAEIRSFDLHHVAAAGIGKVNDILVGVTPLVGDNFYAGTEAGQLFGNGREHTDLVRFITRIHRAFYVERQALRLLLQAGDIVGAANRIHIENQADGAVHVDMQRGAIAGAGAQA